MVLPDQDSKADATFILRKNPSDPDLRQAWIAWFSRIMRENDAKPFDSLTQTTLGQQYHRPRRIFSIPQLAMDKPVGILLIRLKSMGDIVFTLPAAHALRVANPHAQISFLVSREYAPLLKGFRDVNSVVELNRERFRGLNPLKTIGTTLSLVRRLRTARFDLTVDLQGYGETALLTWITRAPARWGTVYRPGRSWAYTHPVAERADVHPAQAHLLLLRGQGVAAETVRNEFVVPEHARVQAGEFMSQNGLRSDQRTIFIQPFTSSPQKNWPLDRYLDLGRRWRDREWQVLFG
jgi:ADP-heptose:LPS heptosyltransferase